ncbi:hypothetical protein [Shinella sumterensis]|uniref:Uncharacterized protein n=1 Tax=Shinella sumterensis TaxID=1967501 RepID=A0AA50CPM3_9HYPH|nr:hypothetical protein [Shinella sumterensis]WLS00531.1 hypothetical protein Q9313_20955 [Shinella sumterensis]
MSVLGPLPESLACRPIEEADWPGVIDCLRRGFPERSQRHWEGALERMSGCAAVQDLPRYGYLLDCEGRVVGVLLALYFRHPGDAIRCNLSSWAVNEEFRSYAGKLIMTAMRRRDVTFLSITPAPVTLKVTEALRFRRFAEGQQAFVPLLSRATGAIRAVVARPGLAELDRLPEEDRTLLLDHAALGCDSVVCLDGDDAYPFVLKPRRVLRGLIPCSQVIYCRSHADLSRCAHALGRHLARKGLFFAVVDACGPVPGLTGRYFAGVGPKYAKGPNPPWPGDLAFTEFAVFDA